MVKSLSVQTLNTPDRYMDTIYLSGVFVNVFFKKFLDLELGNKNRIQNTDF